MNNKIEWEQFQSRFLRIEPGDQADVTLTNWRQEKRSFGDNGPRPALVFDVTAIDEKAQTPLLEWSTTSSQLAEEFRRMIERAEKQEKEFLVVRMKRQSDKRYALMDVSPWVGK